MRAHLVVDQAPHHGADLQLLVGEQRVQVEQIEGSTGVVTGSP
ncbi:hypothetical protein ACFQZ4_27530 [Catellatospora coxensis]